MNYLGISKNTDITNTVKALNQLLADYHIYYQNLRNYHWNIQGKHFFDLHAKFEGLYNEAKNNIDDIAERILTLRQSPMSTLNEYLDVAKVKERSTLDAYEMVTNILEDHKIIIAQLREVAELASKCSDEGTIDMIGAFINSLEKNSWMLDAWSSRS